MITAIFIPNDPSACAGCMYNTFLGCNAPQDYRTSCPSSKRNQSRLFVTAPQDYRTSCPSSTRGSEE